MRSLLLPVDNSSLWAGERVEAVEIELCEACGGAWFDRDEWPLYGERRLDGAPPPRVLAPETREALDRRVAVCPRCGLFLATKAINGARADSCLKCRGIWFDGNEFPTGQRLGFAQRVRRFLAGLGKATT